MKSVIPTKTGHIPLLLYFHLFNVLHGGRKEDKGRLIVLYTRHLKSARQSGVYDSHSLWSEGEVVGGERERVGLGDGGAPTTGPCGRKSKAH